MTLAIFCAGALAALAWQSAYSDHGIWRYVHAVLAVLATGFALTW